MSEDAHEKTCGAWSGRSTAEQRLARAQLAQLVLEPGDRDRAEHGAVHRAEPADATMTTNWIERKTSNASGERNWSWNVNRPPARPASPAESTNRRSL